MTAADVDFARLAEIVAKVKFENMESAYGVTYQLVWSKNRNEVDTQFYFDRCLREIGNAVEIDNMYNGPYYVLTIGDYLYFAPEGDIDAESKNALLRRIKWENVDIVDAGRIKFVRSGDKQE